MTNADNITDKTRPLPSEAFDSLVGAAASGAEWAWARLLEEIDPVLRGYMHKQGADDPDDLAGETWLHVARGINSFEGDYQQFRSWVFMIAHHRIIDARRKKRRRPMDLADESTLDMAGPPARSAEIEALEALEQGEVEELLDQLTHSQREVVLLRVVAGFGITEIADIIGKKPGAVQTLQHRAFKHLRRILEEGVWK